MSINELNLDAIKENLPRALSFLDEKLEEMGCPMKVQMQLDIALEELFVNVANYAYKAQLEAGQEPGSVSVRVEFTAQPRAVEVTLTDRGIPFNPLDQKDPDTSLPAHERRIGGLGIYMAKKSMDHMHYEYKDGQNILTFRKNF